MRLYQPETDEMKLLYWFLAMRAEPEEFKSLFTESLRNLTALLIWAKNFANIMIETDDEGIRYAAWVTPYFDGAEFGTWGRKKYRGSKGHLAFMNQAYDKALEQYPVLIGLTKQPKLHNLHLSVGYEFKCELEGLFDGDTVRVYRMDATTRANRHRVRQEIRDGRRLKLKDIDGNGKQPVRPVTGEIQPSVHASGDSTRRTRKRSVKNRGSQRPNSDNQQGGGCLAPSGVDDESASTGVVGESGPVG